MNILRFNRNNFIYHQTQLNALNYIEQTVRYHHTDNYIVVNIKRYAQITQTAVNIRIALERLSHLNDIEHNVSQYQHNNNSVLDPVNQQLRSFSENVLHDMHCEANEENKKN